MVFGRIKANPCALKVHVCSRLSQHLLHPQFLLFCVLCSHALHTLFHISQQGNDRMLQVYGREPLTNHVLPPCYTHGDRKVNLTLRVTVTNPILPVFMYGFWVLIKIIKNTKFLKSRIMNSTYLGNSYTLWKKLWVKKAIFLPGYL